MTEIGSAGPYTLEDRVTRLEVHVSNGVREQARMTDAVEALDKKMDGRPSWAVVVYLAALQAACGVLATALVILLTNR